MADRGKIGVAIVGAGAFGTRRALAIAQDPRSAIRVVADRLPESAAKLAATVGSDHSANWEEAVARKDVDAVVVATSHRFLPVVSFGALQAGKHVICEKPFGRSSEEVLPAVEEAAKRRLCLKVGYNHRFHPAVAKAHELLQSGTIGEIQFLRGVYGHGGRSGYDREWRADPETAGGGELLDQGVHMLDLFRWFLGDFAEVKAYTATSYWPIAPLEDNVFALLRNQDGKIATLHASWTNWRNVFTLEVFGNKGFLSVTGLGRNYGPQRLCCAVRPAEGVKPEETWFEFGEQDHSLEAEWRAFLDCLESGSQPPSNGQDGFKILQLTEAIYREAHNEPGEQVAAFDGEEVSIPFAERKKR